MTPAQIRQAQQDKTFGKQPSKGPSYTGIRDMFDGGGPGRNRDQARATKSVTVAKDFSKPSGSKVGKPRGGK